MAKKYRRYAGEHPARHWPGGTAMSTYAVIYEHAGDGGWSARAADLPVYASPQPHRVSTLSA
jgi:hypothetical protein